MGIILGLDYGDARVGVAISDPEAKLARRLKTLNSNKNLFDEISKIVESEKVALIIVGLPIGFNGESEQTKKVYSFIDALSKFVDIPIETINEVMTSRIAQDNLIAAGVKNIKELIDQEAARVLLQDYIDHNKI